MGIYFDIANNWYNSHNEDEENDKKEFKSFIFKRFGDCLFRFDANTLNKLDNDSTLMRYIKIYIKTYDRGYSSVNEYYITDEDDIIDADDWETAEDT